MSNWNAPPLVDAHAHIFTRAQPLAANAWTRPDYDFPAEAFLATLDAHGVGFGVIAALSLFEDDNGYVLEALAAHPRRLRATAIVSPDASAQDLRRLADGGFVGVRLQWRNLATLPDPRDALYGSFFARLRDAGLHLQLLSLGAQMPLLLPPIVASGVRLVIDHLGDPDPERGVESPGFEAVLRAVDSGNTLVKLSATSRFPFERAQSAATRLLEVAGPERLVWGSDAPFIGHDADTAYADVLGTFVRLVPNAAQRHAIGMTALREWFF